MLSTDQVQQTTSIRRAGLDDLNAIVAMSGRFLLSTEYRGLLKDDPEQRLLLAHRLIDGVDSIIFVAERDDTELVGFLALQLYDHPMSGQRFCCEAAWWVEPGSRGRVGLQLLKVGEAWAKGRHAEVFQMIAPTPDVERIYERRGYVAVERHYHKVL